MHKSLPLMSNQEFEFVEQTAKDFHISFKRCPTCDAAMQELYPGIWDWPKDSTYKLYDEIHVCDCAEQIELLRHYLLAGIPKDYWRLSDSPSDYWGDPAALEAVRNYFSKWDKYKKFGIGMAIYSPNMGVGKTFLATLLAKWLIHSGEHVVFAPFRDAVALYDLSPDKREEKIARLRNAPVLILDEVRAGLTAAQMNYLAIELEDLLRFRTSGNSVTIVTTNLTPEELDKFFEKSFSLLSSKQILVEVSGEDVRKNGDKRFLDLELIANGEMRPLV